MIDFMSTDMIWNWMMSTGLAVTIMIAVILMIRRPVARAFGSHWAYALWSLPVLRMIMPPIVLPALPVRAPQPVEMGEVPFLIQMPGSQAIAAQPDISINWIELGVAVWIMGGALWLILQLARHAVHHRHLLKNTSDVSGNLRSIIDNVSSELKIRRNPFVKLSSAQDGPLVSGLFRPVIILPRDFETDYSERQQYFALMHEFAHIRRRDLWAAFAALIFRAVNWPNPLVHFAATRFRIDQEAACDHSVLKLSEHHNQQERARADYAETLVHAARKALPNHVGSPLGLTIYHPLKERLMILNFDKTKAGRLTRAGLMAGIAACVLTTAPYIRAENDTLAGEDVTVHVNAKEKQVIKWVEDNNGIKTTKQYEVIKEDGETTAWEIDELGNRTVVDPSTIKGLKIHSEGTHAWVGENGTLDLKAFKGMHGENANVFILNDEDGDSDGVKKRVRIVTKSDSGEVLTEDILQRLEDGEFEMDGEREVIIKKLGDGDGQARVFAFSTDSDTTIDLDGHGFAFGSGGHASSMVRAAESLVEKAEAQENMSGATRKKLEKARRALAEAQEALEAEQQD